MPTAPVSPARISELWTWSREDFLHFVRYVAESVVATEDAGDRVLAICEWLGVKNNGDTEQIDRLPWAGHPTGATGAPRAIDHPPIMTADPPTRDVVYSEARSSSPRLEDTLELYCCGQPARLAGNLALRGAGSPTTRLAYECASCHRRLQVVDDWDRLSSETLAAVDETP
jgi:hypothetical protein